MEKGFTLHGERDAPEILTVIDHHGAALVIDDGVTRVEARPSPRDAFEFGMWWITWAITRGVRPNDPTAEP